MFAEKIIPHFKTTTNMRISKNSQNRQTLLALANKWGGKCFNLGKSSKEAFQRK